jgi:hypothetical protein
MRKPPSKTGRARRRRAKTTVDFATGEVHDRLLDAAGEAAALSPEELSNEDRAQLGVDEPSRLRRARAANQANRRGWVKARKSP